MIRSRRSWEGKISRSVLSRYLTVAARLHDVANYMDFDRSPFRRFSEERLAEQLYAFPQLMTNHLQIAAWIEFWISQLAPLEPTPAEPRWSHGVYEAAKYRQGLTDGLLELAMDLRLGDLLPGGALLANVETPPLRVGNHAITYRRL